eukprot:CAMPEP_0179035546 /NCGR_PEP_ID=MMETSP0796-20121207/13166_1 /TAXON_ID=73915 /ORGANISM="Pyrodinium bahamense, Strain pbaha01" /LENGTH=280 /DNA_ID=CAMNT_0020731821 /DNA_START=101 /DNA_END=943 /DNA_ORIENTATION=+
MAHRDDVRGMAEVMKQANAGLALLQKTEEFNCDVPRAEAFKAEHELAIKSKEEQANALTGKDNKKARAELGKQVAAMKGDPRYIDACKVAKGLAPPNGNFDLSAPKPVALATKLPPGLTAGGEADMTAVEDVRGKGKDAKPKKVESAGLSRAEKDELERLKVDIIAKKAALKAEGKSGGECNKDPEVVQMVARMQELKIKEDPSLAEGDTDRKDKGKDKAKKSKGALSSAEQAELGKLEAELEAYRQRLIHEFGYSKKDIAADPEFQEMEKTVKEFRSRA